MKLCSWQDKNGLNNKISAELVSVDNSLRSNLAGHSALLYLKHPSRTLPASSARPVCV